MNTPGNCWPEPPPGRAWVTGPEWLPGDAYLEGGFVVFTEQFHLRRGFCCGSGCRHCPYRDPENAA